VVVFDHGVSSPWAYYVVEEEKVRASWEAVKAFRMTRHSEYRAEQRFGTYDELLAKVQVQGNEAVRRIERFKGQSEVVIPMTYELALLER
jgi:hypothetical protein